MQTKEKIYVCSVLLPERFGGMLSLAPSAPDLTGFSRVPSTISLVSILMASMGGVQF